MGFSVLTEEPQSNLTQIARNATSRHTRFFRPKTIGFAGGSGSEIGERNENPTNHVGYHYQSPLSPSF